MCLDRAWSEAVVKKSKKDGKLILIDVYADWCGPCRMMDRTTYRSRVVLAKLKSYVAVKVNADVDVEAAQRFSTGSLPTTVVLDSQGRQILQTVGYLPPDEFVGFLGAAEENLAEIKGMRKKAESNPGDGTLALDLGKRYFEFIRSNDFQLPGERGGAPEPVILHDLTHTIGGYGTDPAGEMQVIGFHAGYRKANPFTWVFFGMMQFHMGIRVGLLAKGESGNFNPELMLEAIARGAAMNIDLTDSWDPWTVMDRDIDELRAEYNIAPKD